MPAEIYPDVIHINVPALAPVPFNFETGAGLSCLPLPQLEITETTIEKAVQGFVLENDVLRAFVATDLGGRLLSLYSKPAQRELLLPANRLPLVASGARGADLPVGVAAEVGSPERLLQMAPMQHRIFEGSEDAPPTLLLYEIDPSLNIGWYLKWQLDDERPELQLSVRAQNHRLRPVPFGAAVSVHLLGDAALKFVAPDGLAAFWSDELGLGLMMIEDQPLCGEFTEAGWIHAPKEGMLGPRQVDSFSLRLIPLVDPAPPALANGSMSVHVAENSLRIHSFDDRPAHKIFLLTPDDQTLEASADLNPSKLTEFDLGALPGAPVAVQIRTPDKTPVLAGDLSATAVSPRKPAPYAPPVFPAGVTTASEEPDLVRLAQYPGLQHAGLLLRAAKLQADEQPLDSAKLVDEALDFNAQDALLWWQKAALARLNGQGDEVSQPNAHYLSPMEPMLRAEGFLMQSEQPKEPNPLLAPLAEFPETFVHVALVLIEAGMWADAVRWLDEALRHVKSQRLLLLMAALQARNPALKFEASRYLADAESLGIEPPLPTSPIELELVNKLQTEFPENDLLNQLNSVAPRLGSLS